jgi:type II secretory pathway component PulF
MPLIVLPSQLADRGELYHQFSQLINAGIGLLQAIETLRRNPPARSFRIPLSRWLDQLNQGATFGEALQSGGAWLPAFDVALLQAGEKSGRLPACFKLLGDYYQERARLLREMLSRLMYPLFLFHFAIFIMPIAQLFGAGGLRVYAKQTIGALLPLYLLVFIVAYAAQGKHGERWRGFLERIGRGLPVLGRARHELALARLAAALEALLNAGVNVIEAWELAANASGSPALRRTVRSWRAQLEAGAPPSEALRRSRQFPELFANMYHTGEISGQLDETLHRLHVLYQDSATQKFRALAEWTPRLVYLMVALMIARWIVSFYIGYFGRISDALNF